MLRPNLSIERTSQGRFAPFAPLPLSSIRPLSQPWRVFRLVEAT